MEVPGIKGSHAAKTETVSSGPPYIRGSSQNIVLKTYEAVVVNIPLQNFFLQFKIRLLPLQEVHMEEEWEEEVKKTVIV